MKNKIKKITLITGTESTKLALLTQLKVLLGEYVEIESYSIDSGINAIIKSDLVIVSTKLIIDECIDYIHKECPVVLARRSLNISNIDKVFSIPAGSDVLLVNDAIETSIETIELLKDLGIDDLNYIPYYPGCQLSQNHKFAITPGELALVPSSVKKIVNLGPRLIDLTTIVEILEKLDLLDEKAHSVSAKYLETIINLSKQLYSSTEESNNSNKYLIVEQTLDMDTKLRRILLKKGHISKYTFEDIIGESDTIKSTIEIAKKLSKTDLTILIHGETGTGKELFAGSIHNESEGSNGPYLAVNFSSISEDLVESELFGYEEGAFTGARKGGKIGLFEQANNGTIFLDEIGDTSLKIQARLLRVLQEKEIMRVGGTEIIPINVRILAATNKDLTKMCKDGTFREDLYYRLKQLYLKTPSLRYRKEDFPLLIEHFLAKNNRNNLILSQEVIDIINSYDWPGNIRELENLIEYMVAVCDSTIITKKDIPEYFFDSIDDFSINSELDEINDYLSSKGNIEDFHFIMGKILERNKLDKSVGRKWISDQSIEHCHFMTEEQIRFRSDILEELKLISKGKGPMGMRLTDDGIRYIKTIK